MPEEQEKLSSEDREALGVGRAVLWIKKNWQFLALAGFIGGPNALAMLTPRQEAEAPKQDTRLAVVETKLQTLTEQVNRMDSKLDRVLRRQSPDLSAAPTEEPRDLASIRSGSVSRALRSMSTPTPGPFSVTP